MSGRFKVQSGGCSDAAGYSAGSVPFMRLFDANGRRIAGLARINGSCSKTAKLYVQHSGNYYRTGKNIGFGAVNTMELRIAVSTPSKSLVQVYLNNIKVYESTIADNGLKPVASVNMHNEHPDQVGDLIADDVRVATFGVTAPVNPCDAAVPAADDDRPRHDDPRRQLRDVRLQPLVDRHARRRRDGVDPDLDHPLGQLCGAAERDGQPGLEGQPRQEHARGHRARSGPTAGSTCWRRGRTRTRTSRCSVSSTARRGSPTSTAPTGRASSTCA